MSWLYLLTYFSAAIFIIGILYKIVKYACAPVHLRWELYPIAHDRKRSSYGGSYLEEYEWWTKVRKKSHWGSIRYMLGEIFLFRGIWQHYPGLFSSHIMHLGIYCTVIMGFLLLGNAILNISIFSSMTFSHIISKLTNIIGWTGYSLGIVGTLGMLWMRMFNKRLRTFNSFATYFNLLFLLSIFTTGLFSLLDNSHHFQQIENYFRGLLTLDFANFPALLDLHIASAILFMFYLPFTHMTHFFSKYFTYHFVRWNDEPNIPGSKMEKALSKALNYPINWSAKHINCECNPTWNDIAFSEAKENEK